MIASECPNQALPQVSQTLIHRINKKIVFFLQNWIIKLPKIIPVAVPTAIELPFM